MCRLPWNPSVGAIRNIDVGGKIEVQITILVARICQSSIHWLVEQTNVVAGIRFAFFFVQAICMITMGILVVILALLGDAI